jgi:succinate dehydrogenase / fumarate reductase membrane anchor subunit
LSVSGFRTPRSRAKGLGSAKHGVGVWIAERITSFALIPLVLWGVYSALEIAKGGYDGAVDWVGQPLNAVLMALLLGVSFHHMQMGMRVIVEDYIHKPSTKIVLLLLNGGICWLGGALAVFAVLRVAFRGQTG